MAANPSDKAPKKPVLREETKVDRWGDRQRKTEEKPALPMGTLMDATSTIRFVSPNFAVEQARNQSSAWDRAKRVETKASTATTAMSDLPARVVEELRARRAAEAAKTESETELDHPLDEIPTIDLPRPPRNK